MDVRGGILFHKTNSCLNCKVVTCTVLMKRKSLISSNTIIVVIVPKQSKPNIQTSVPAQSIPSQIPQHLKQHKAIHIRSTASIQRIQTRYFYIHSNTMQYKPNPSPSVATQSHPNQIGQHP